MADTTIKLSGTYDSIEAYNILEEMRNMSSDYEEIRTKAAEAVSAATAASAAATNAINTANTAANNAKTYAGNANTSAGEAAGYAANASTAATNAASSATNASNSAAAAATSESNAATSETNAAASAAAAALAITPTGSVLAFAGRSSPAGWLLCDGSAVSRTEYAALFTVIGTTYGSGNGTSTFNLPNLTNKFIEGSSTAGTTKAAGLPNITGYIGVRGCTNTTIFGTANGALSSETTTNLGDINMGTTSASHPTRLYFNASNSNSIYGNSTTVQPPALTMRYIIKY